MDNNSDLTTTTGGGVSLLEAVYERYSDLSDLNGVLSFRMAYSSNGLERSTAITPRSPPKSDQPSVDSADVDIQISPRRRQLLASVSMVLSDKNIDKVGEIEELESVCKNVQELELSCNQLKDWDEIKNLFTALKRLRWLNLRANKLLCDNIMTNDSGQIKDYFSSNWPQFTQIKTLILDQCMFPFDLVVQLVSRLPQLTELHLTDNSYTELNTAFANDDHKHEQLKMLFLNQNSLSDWKNLTLIGKLFPNLEHLMLSDNKLKSFEHHEADNADLFPNLKLLSVCKNPIDDWTSVDQLRRFPALEHVRLQGVPLLADINDDNKKFSLIVGFLSDKLKFLNGSPIKPEEKETGERAFLRHFLDQPVKPERYYELEKKHGTLPQLVDIDLSKLGLDRRELLKQSRFMKRAVVKINFDESNVVQVVENNVDLRQTVAEFKKRLEKHVGLPSSGFRIYFTDSDGSPYGPEELRHMNKTLQQAKIKENHEFIIILR